MSPAGVRVRGLTWRPFGARHPILDGVELTIAAGERVLVTGPSGGGKSTLLKALAGVLSATEHGDLAGEILVGGKSPRGGDVGLLVQDPAAAMVAATAWRDVAFGLENRGVPRAEMRGRVTAALKAVGFPYELDRSPRALSGGEAQRLALAGVIAPQPGLLALDEPTAMLDAAAAANVRAAVAGLVADRGSTLVVVEQRLDGWVELVDRLVVIVAGQVVADGPITEVLATRAAELVAHGVWVPGVEPPEPVPVAPALGMPSTPHAVGETLLTALELGVTLRPPTGLRIAHRPPAPTLAVQNVTFPVTAGQLHALLGSSGAGKSTLLQACAGLVKPTSGEVVAAPPLARSAGAVPHAWVSRDLAERIAWVPQRAALTIAGNTVADSAAATVRALGRPTERVAELLTALGLDRVRSHNPHTLSGGEQRRLALVSALAHGPEVLMLDEPTVGQDRHTWAAVAGVVTAARTAGTAVAMATHDSAIAHAADTTSELSHGAML